MTKPYHAIGFRRNENKTSNDDKCHEFNQSKADLQADFDATKVHLSGLVHESLNLHVIGSDIDTMNILHVGPETLEGKSLPTAPFVFVKAVMGFRLRVVLAHVLITILGVLEHGWTILTLVSPGWRLDVSLSLVIGAS